MPGIRADPTRTDASFSRARPACSAGSTSPPRRELPPPGGDIAWTPFPSGIYLTLCNGEPALEEYRLDQPIAADGFAPLRVSLSADPASGQAGLQLGQDPVEAPGRSSG